MQIILITFATTAIGGILLATHAFRRVTAPWSLSVLHGSLGALGLFMLAYELLTGTYATKLFVGFIILVIAALGGLYLLSFHTKKQIPPTKVVVIHAIAAVMGFSLLVLAALNV